MSGVLVVKFKKFKSQAELEISQHKLQIEDQKRKIEGLDQQIVHFVEKEKEFNERLDEAAEQYDRLYDELDKIYNVNKLKGLKLLYLQEETNVSERLEGIGKWRHIDVETDPVQTQDKSILVELIVQQPEIQDQSRMNIYNKAKDNKSDTASHSARDNSKLQKKNKITKFNIKGIIASKGLAKKLKKKIKHKNKPSDKLSKMRSKIKENENLSHSSRSRKSNRRSKSQQNSMRNDDDEHPIMYPTLTVDSDKVKQKLITIPIEVDNPLEITKFFKRSKSFSKQRTGKRFQSQPKIEVHNLENHKAKNAVSKINVNTTNQNKTYIMKYKGKLKELIPSDSENKKNELKALKASSTIKRLIAIAAARKFCPYKFQ